MRESPKGDTMTAADREAYHDAEIAPKLLVIAEECKTRGLSFLAMCAWTPHSFSRTAFLQDDAGLAFRLVDGASRCHGNIDSLWLAIQKHARIHGHSSLFLRQQGIPETPLPPDTVQPPHNLPFPVHSDQLEQVPSKYLQPRDGEPLKLDAMAAEFAEADEQKAKAQAARQADMRTLAFHVLKVSGAAPRMEQP